jgi:hypothetical protein
MLHDKLKLVIQNKCSGQLSQGVVLLHDKAHPNTAVHIIQTLQQLCFDVKEHPPYTPDITPSGYHLSGPLKNALRGHHFVSYHKLKEAVHMWLAAQLKTFFSLKAYRSLCVR